MTQPQKFSCEFQRDAETAKVFCRQQFALYGISAIICGRKSFVKLIIQVLIVDCLCMNVITI